MRIEHEEPSHRPEELAARGNVSEGPAPQDRPMRSMMLGLQGSIGNRAVVRLVQRDGPIAPVKKNEPAGPLDASFFTAGTQEPSVTGTTHIASATVPTSVKVVAPRFEWHNSVKMAKDVPGGSGIDVGFQQVLMGSARKAQYKAPHGGQQFGYSIATPESRDAALEVAGKTGKGFQAGEVVVPPGGFFSENSAIGGRARLTLAPKLGEVAEPNMFDVPSFETEKVREGNPLVGTGGEDKFRVSLVAKEQGKSPIFLANREWAVNWAQSVDTAAPGGPTSAGGQGISVKTTSDGVPQLDGSTPHFLGKAWYQFTSLAAAASATTTILMANLSLAAAGGDTQSHGFTVDALRARNPEFKISVACSETAAFFGKDTVTVSLNGVASKIQSMTLGLGDRGELKAKLLDIFPDPAAITSASPLTLTLTVVSDRNSPSETTTVAHPFLSIPVKLYEVGNIDAGKFTMGGGLY